jgi:biofilm PGA synthesis N-glycosyltransferase PgaC
VSASAAIPALGAQDYSASHWRERDRQARSRFLFSLLVGALWVVFSIWLSLPWLSDLGDLTHPLIALFILTFIAYLPGFMNAFLLMSLVLRPDAMRRTPAQWPAITILVAAYKEEAHIGETLRSLGELSYPGALQIIVIDDGSPDGTSAAVQAAHASFAGAPGKTLDLVRLEANVGKARALNRGLKDAAHALVVTIDADTLLQPNCLVSMVEHLTASPPETAAIAGTVFVRNHKDSWITAAQQWDYFHGIAAVKRMQGMYDGTLVAQGAFSIYRREALVEAGGWPDTVGEDIVLTWALLRAGHKIGHAEDAVAWTHAPETLKGLANQRKRWARGMIEALALHKGLLAIPRARTMFIWWNLLFVSIDFTFTFVFIPGLILAFLGIFWLAGPITLLVLPIAALWNLVIYRIQTRMLKREGIEMDKSGFGFVLYALIYPLLMQPVSVWGYFAELIGGRKQWDAI